MVLAGCLDDREDGAAAGQLSPELFQPLSAVRHAQPVAKRMNIDIEPGFTGVDAEVDFRLSAWFGQLLALHAGLAPHHLFRTGAKDGRTKLSHGSGPGLHGPARPILGWVRSEEHTSELQSLMRISYAVFCLKKK